MSLLFGYMANDPGLLRAALRAGAPLIRSPDAPDGWGIGFYQGGEVLLQRHPKPQREGVDFYARLRELRTDNIVGHVRAATIGGQKNENTHPYRFRSWLFAHNGTIAKFRQVEKRIVETIPEFLLRNIRGQTDSETVFHLFLAFLHDSGKLDDQTIQPKVAAQALKSTTAFLDRLLGEPTELNVVLTNGRLMLAARRGRPMVLQRQHGVADAPHELPRGATVTDRAVKPAWHEHLRSVLIVSDPPEAAAAAALPEHTEAVLVPIADDSIVAVSRDLSVEVIPLRGDPL